MTTHTIILEELPGVDASDDNSTIYRYPSFSDGFTGVLESINDKDRIAVWLRADRTYDISLSGYGEEPAGDTILTVFDSRGNEVAHNDDVGPRDLSSRVEFTPEKSGTYYIQAAAYGGNPRLDHAGSYKIEIDGPGFGRDHRSLISYADSDTGVEASIMDRGVVALQGSTHNDILTGDENDNWLFANGGDLGTPDGEDRLIGGAGNDWLFAGSGYVVLEGGEDADYIVGVDDEFYSQGFELASYESSRTSVFVDLGAGTATGGDAEGDVLVYIDGLIGSDNGDDLTGNELGNELWGGDGDDILHGGGATGFYYDYMEGGPGADVLIGSDGFDYAGYTESEEAVEIRLHDGTIKGGDAEGDTYHGIDHLIGSQHDDILAGDDGVNWLFGQGGSDVLEGRAGDDFLLGDPFADEGGNDVIDAGEGNDFIRAGSGANVIMGGPGFDYADYFDDPEGVEVNLAEGSAINGWGGVDSLHDIEGIGGSLHDDNLVGDEADNTLDGYRGNDVIHGGMGNDFLQGAEGDDELHGEDGDDQIYGDYYGSLHGGTTGGDDKLYGGAGNDRLHGRVGNDELYGGEGNDFLHAEPGDDMLDGGEGNDYLYGGPGADTLIGGDGIDYAAYEDSDAAIEVRLHDNTALGGYAEGDSLDGIERVHGSNYDDIIEGDHNENALHGFDGNDVLNGREGNDWFEGGEGNDTFVFAPGNGYDRISDFSNGEDRIDLSAFENIESVSDLSISQDGNVVVIDLSGHGGGDISLEAFNEADLTDAHFIF